MATKRNEFAEQLDCTWKILNQSIDLFMFAQYLNTPDTKQEGNFITRHTHLSFIRYGLWKLMIIDIAKLFSSSESQKFNLIKLLGKLKTGGYFRSLKFDEVKLTEWETGFIRHTTAINEVDILRNKYYAHSDRDPFKQENTNLTFPQIKALIDFANEIVVELGSRILSTHMFVKPMYFDSRNMDFVKILADEELRSLEQFAKANGFGLKDIL